MVEYKLVRLCQDDSMCVMPSRPIKIDVPAAASRLNGAGHRAEAKSIMLAATVNGRELTLYRTGRMVMKGVKSKDEARELADLVYGVVGTVDA